MARRRAERAKLGKGPAAEREAEAQRLLLQAVESLAPWVLEELRDSLLAAGGSMWFPDPLTCYPPELTDDQREALNTWATRFNLNAPWALRAAQETLMGWTLDPSLATAERLQWTRVMTGAIWAWPEVELRIRWDPNWQPIADFDEAVANARKIALKARKQALGDGVPTEMPEDWFDWTALYLCGRLSSDSERTGLSYDEILSRPDLLGLQEFPVQAWSLSQAVNSVLRACQVSHPRRRGGKRRRTAKP